MNIAPTILYYCDMEFSPFLKQLVLNIMVTSVALLLGDYLMDNVYFTHSWVALIAAFCLALLNVVLKPLLIVLTIPATIFTLGLFLLVINTVMLMIADQMVDGFAINTFWAAFLLSLFISFFSGIINGNVKIEKHKR